MRSVVAKPAGLMLFSAVWLAACQHQPSPTLPPLPPQQIETGSTLNLLAPLTFPAGRSELLFQAQKQVAAEALSPTLPYCKLVSPLAGAHSVTAGPMTVTGVNYDEREAGQSSAMFSMTRISLSAGSQSSGYEMRCGWPRPSSNPAFLTTEQIYGAIGGQFSMQLRR